MNTDKLMELESLATDMDNFGHDLYQGGQALSDFADRARTIAAALRAEQAVGEEQVARELFADELEKAGMAKTAKHCRAGKLIAGHQPALRAIRRALGTARQSEGMVLVPREPTEAMFAAALPLHQRMGQFKLTMIWNAMLAAAPGGEGEG